MDEIIARPASCALFGVDPPRLAGGRSRAFQSLPRISHHPLSQLVNGQMHGRGTYFHADGSIYVGFFR